MWRGSKPKREDVEPLFWKGYEYRSIVLLLQKRGFKVSLPSLKRWLSSWGLKRRDYEKFLLEHPEEFDALMEKMRGELQGPHQRLGARLFHVHVRSKFKVPVTRRLARLAQGHFDPVGVARRQKRAKKHVDSNRYYCKGPGDRLHLDGNDKMTMWGFCITGAIDGYSRYVHYARVLPSNKDPDEVVRPFLDYVAKAGVSRVVRLDNGTENGKIATAQAFFRSFHTDDLANDKSVWFGPSTQNHRIESWWNQLGNAQLRYWKPRFERLLEATRVDLSKPLERTVFHFVFAPLVQATVDEYVEIWNMHRIRKNPNVPCPPGVPAVVFAAPESMGATDRHLPVSAEALAYARTQLAPGSARPWFDEDTGALLRQLCGAVLRELTEERLGAPDADPAAVQRAYECVTVDNADAVVARMLLHVRRMRG